MGEVYKAKDTRLDRLVAVKVLPASLASDPEFRERFEREAKSISALNHPNICTLYDVGRENDTEFLVMELLEGETLAVRIQKGPLPVTDALKIAIEIAGALDKAHRQGIVHRDFKPGNVMLTKTGAKLLDFGLAKVGPAGVVSGSAATTMPTITNPLTSQGTILGTFQYMAPEQIEGEEADARTDLFAFGAVLYEMLTGRKAFTGKSQASLLGAILKDEPPPVSSVQALTPPALDRVVKTCLAKERDDRFQTAHDLLLQLQWIAEGGSAAGVPAPVVAHRKHRERAAWIAFAVVAALWLVTLVPAWKYFRAPVDDRQIRFSIVTPDTLGGATGIGASPVVSPDGRLVAFASPLSNGARPVLWVRALDSVEARSLPGTEGAGSPFWSPDGLRLGFAASGALKTIALSGGPPQALCDIGSFAGGTWNRGGVIVIATGPVGSLPGLVRVSEADGSKTPIAKADSTQGVAYGWPVFLPDNRHVLFTAFATEAAKRGIYAQSIDGGPPTLVLKVESMAAFAAPGFLLYQRQGTLFVQAFDTDTLKVSGEPLRVAEDVLFSSTNARGAFSVSNTGILVYRTGQTSDAVADLAWFSREGKSLGVVGEAGGYNQVRLSPDEKRVATSRLDSKAGKYDIYTLDLPSNITSRLTFEDASVNDPVWSPDSRSVAFEVVKKGKRDFYRQIIGTRDVTLLFESPDDPKWLDDWSPNGPGGQFLLFHVPGAGTLYACALSDSSTAAASTVQGAGGAADRKPLALTRTTALVDSAHFSPDGKLVSYATNESGPYETWVAPFPAFNDRRQVSAHGGGQARWRGDGKELFYLAPEGQMMSVEISTDPKTGAIESKTPTVLFQSPIQRPTLTIDQYDVTSDGKRFLFIQPHRDQNTSLAPITVVVNWQAVLSKK
jgi:Tol biopolymer transport system component